MKNVLVLGAGLVAAPLVRYLLARADARTVVAAMNVDRARQLVRDHPRGVAVHLDVDDRAALEASMRDADLVVSLLPQTHHPRVARLAIARRIPMVTTSYVSDEMRSLDGEARRAGVIVLGEIGLDPGIDHMSALRLIDGIRREGGEVRELSSCCGGLPAPDSNDNPWGYKFSWSPRGALLAGRNPARFRRGGEAVDIEGPRLFEACWPIAIDGLGRFEVYPNRDSLAYAPLYGIEQAEGVFRGTIRYPGWCATLRAVAALGLLEVEEISFPASATHADLVARALPAGSGSLPGRIAAHLGLDESDPILHRLVWAGLLDDTPLPRARAAPLDLLSERLQEKMSYAPGERDMIVLRHEVLARRSDRATVRVVSELVALGTAGGDSAMATTVSLPAAVAARRILDGKIDAVGVAIPVLREIYEPVLDELADLGISFEERTVVDGGGPG